MLEIGQPAPGFTLLDQHGSPVSWDDFRGRPVVVFFYPKANTSGCTKEACSFRDLRAEFDQRGVAVARILDLACGTGTLALELAKQGHSFILTTS